MTSKLRFYAKADLLVSDPSFVRQKGSPPRYVGRSFDASALTHPASKEAAEYDANSPAGQQLIKRMKKEDPKPLFPADEFTAQACGCSFDKVVFKDGEWIKA